MAERTQRYRGKDYGKYSYVVPNPNDILCGKDRNTFSHLGNRRFRYIISMNASSYVETRTKRERSFMVGAIVSMIKEKGARFVKKDHQAKMYYEICTEHARDKVAHALRDTCARVSKFKSDERSQSEKGKEKNSANAEKLMKKRIEDVYRTVEEASQIDTLPLRTAVPDCERIPSGSKPGGMKSKGWHATHGPQRGEVYQMPSMVTPPRATPTTMDPNASLHSHPLTHPSTKHSSPSLDYKRAEQSLPPETSSFQIVHDGRRAFGRYPPTWDHAMGNGHLHGTSQSIPSYLAHTAGSGVFVHPMDLNPSAFPDMYTPIPLQPLSLDVPYIGPSNFNEQEDPPTGPSPDVVPASEADLEPWPAHLGNDHPHSLLHSVDVLENLIAE